MTKEKDHSIQLHSEALDAAEAEIAAKDAQIEKLEKTCEEYAVWLAEKEQANEKLKEENAALLREEAEILNAYNALCEEQKPKAYGMAEWKGGEAARASYIERITALEKVAADQERITRAKDLVHQAEIEKLRKALGTFLVDPDRADFSVAIEAARRALANEQV